MQNYPITRSQGNFSWPNGARIAVVLTSEYEPVYEIKPLAGGQPNYRQMAEMRYEATRGIWRILDVLKRHGVVSTFFVNGATAKEYPESVKAIAAQGHEVAAHSWNAADHFTMSKDAEDQLIGRVIESLEKASGKRPSGWLTPRAQVSEHTIDLIPRDQAWLPEIDDLVRALRHCKGTACRSSDREFRFTFKAGSNAELVLTRLEVAELPPCDRRGIPAP